MTTSDLTVPATALAEWHKVVLPGASSALIELQRDSVRAIAAPVVAQELREQADLLWDESKPVDPTEAVSAVAAQLRARAAELDGAS